MTNKLRAVVIRWASIGDAIQASSPIAELSDAGFTVDVATSTIGEQVLRHDPHVSKISIIEPGHPTPGGVPEDYRDWINRLSDGYDRVANLVYSVEGEIATEPGNRNYYLPIEVRRALYGPINYVERQHVLAQVPFHRNRQWFYETIEERTEIAESLAGSVSVGVCLGGSHPYKVWPDLPRFCVDLLRGAPVRLVLLGSFEARDMIAEKEVLDEIAREFGPLDEMPHDVMQMISAPLRTSLAMACHVDVLVGPDTGLTNAAAMRPNRKIVMLAHNTWANATKGWKNTATVSARVPCSPCLRLHHRPGDCPQVNSKPACVWTFDYEAVLTATLDAVTYRRSAA